jgi:hypothetical protein
MTTVKSDKIKKFSEHLNQLAKSKEQLEKSNLASIDIRYKNKSTDAVDRTFLELDYMEDFVDIKALMLQKVNERIEFYKKAITTLLEA